MSTKISATPPAAALTGSELVPIVQAGQTVHTSVDDIAARSGAATAGRLVGINAQTGTAYALVLSDVGSLVEQTNAAAVTTTVPSHASVALPVNAIIYIAQGGAGQVTVAAGVGVTLKPAVVKTRAQDSVIALVQTAADVWRAMGDMA